MSSRAEVSCRALGLDRCLFVLLALGVLGAGLTGEAAADSITYTAYTDEHGGLFPLFPEGLGTLKRVEISGMIGGGVPYLNDSDSEQDGTTTVGFQLFADGIGVIAADSVDVTYSADPFARYNFGASVNFFETFNSNLDGFVGSDTGGNTGFFASLDSHGGETR
jgi:hypothetical protein